MTLPGATSNSTRQPRRLRVCHLAYTFYDSDNRVMRYVQALSERGDEVDVLSLKRPDQKWKESEGGITWLRIQRRTPTEQRAATYLLKIVWFFLKATVLLTILQPLRRYDVVHVHNIPDFLVFAAWLPRLTGSRIVLDIHDILPELYCGKFGAGGGSTAFRALVASERLCCRFAHHVIVANHLWRDRLIERSVPTERCSVFLNYPDLTIFQPAKGPRQDGRFVILYPGSLNHHQGLDIAVRAFAEARPQMPDAEFHIYGRGPALPDLISLAETLQLGEAVQFRESVPLKEVAVLMAGADLGVVPKRADGFGNEAFSTKIFEFMACQVPVIISRTRIDAFYFTDAVATFFEPGNAEDLARAMVAAYRDTERRRRIAAEAHHLALSYGWQAHSGDYAQLIDSLSLASPRAGSTSLQGIP